MQTDFQHFLWSHALRGNVIFVILFLILPFLNAHAEPVRKDVALTQHYSDYRSGESDVETETDEENRDWHTEPPEKQDAWKAAIFKARRAKTEPSSSTSPRQEMLTPYLETLRRWKNPPEFLDLSELYEWEPAKPEEEKKKGFDLPLRSNLQITGHKSVEVQLNKTIYFGQGDVNRFAGSGFQGGYGSGLDLGLTSSYSYGSSSSFGGGYGGGFGGGYGSGFGGGFSTSSFGGVPRASGLNIRQTLQVGLHGRVGERTHVAIDYSDSGGSSFSSGYGSYGGYGGGVGGAKEQKIRVWYEGTADSILKEISFGDITLDLPNTRFLNVTRNLFGLQAKAELGGIRVTAFGSRSKGISDTRRFRGESRRAGFGRGVQIVDANYVKERFYFIQLDEDGLLHDSYLPIKQGTEEIYIDDGVAGNNQGGQRTSQGYFNLQFPSQDYNIDYKTGEIEFLARISASYKIVVAYKYLGNDGGEVGNPGNVFEDENGDGTIDEEGEELGYVVIKDKAFRGTEARRVYHLGNRNISPRDYQIIIFRQGGGRDV